MKRLIIVSGYAGTGKTTVGKALAQKIDALFLDKETIVLPLVEGMLAAKGLSEDDRMSDFYLREVRPKEYASVVETAFENLAIASNPVVIAAPFLYEVGWKNWTEKMVARCASLGAKFSVVWVECDFETARHRLVERGFGRDRGKIYNWDAYIKRHNDPQQPENIVWQRIDTTGEWEQRIGEIAADLAN